IDVSRDGKVDLVVAASTTNGDVSVFLGNGDGTFLGETRSPAGANFVPMTVADFDGDGNPDVAGSDPFGYVGIVFGTGDGRMINPAKLGSYVSCNDLVPFDVDGDGRQDLVITHGASAEILVLHNAGNGAFTAGQSIPAPGGSSALVL